MERIYCLGWSDFRKNQKQVVFLTMAIALAFISLHLKKSFLKYNEARQGYHLEDKILDLIPATDVNTAIFLLTYGGIIFGIFLCLLQPYRNMHLCFSVMMVVTLRMITMYFLPLEPPKDIIPLKDLFLQCTFYENGTLVKDLFFSGHTASLFLLYLLNKDRTVSSKLLLMSSIFLGILLLVQHVHYTIDVIAAFPFAYLTYLIGAYFTKKISS